MKRHILDLDNIEWQLMDALRSLVERVEAQDVEHGMEEELEAARAALQDYDLSMEDDDEPA